jgi:serine protease Do
MKRSWQVWMLLLLPTLIQAGDLEEARKLENDRISVIKKVTPAVVAIFSPGGGGGGSGVLISPEGYTLTNFHVVAGSGPAMVAGLADGILYDTIIVGQDKVGDVALIKLIPKEAGKSFPFVSLSDSDKVKVGDWSLAMGNPFLLATDFTPSISFGMISGTHRYQYPEGDFLEYTDCIQFDTTINPGNSGGPLFNLQGELIGINGRGSFAQDKRFRINCGVGYAISINQIKNFMGHLRAGLDVDHATLGAAVQTADEDADLSRMIVKELLEDVDVTRRGLLEGDQVIAFANRPVSTVNQYKNILGIFPRDWRVPMTYRRGEGKRTEILVRLQGYQSSNRPTRQKPQPKSPEPKVDKPPSPALKYFKEKKGFINYYFNDQMQQSLLAAFQKQGDFASLNGNWNWTGLYEADGRKGSFTLLIQDRKDAETSKPLVSFKTNAEYKLDPLKTGQSDVDRSEPPNSGGFLMAMYQYRRFLSLAAKGFEGGFSHGGYEPIYPPSENEKTTVSERRIMTEVIRSEHAAVPCKWYFFRKELNPQITDNKIQDGTLIAFETFISSKDQDPCEVYFSEFRPIESRTLPSQVEIVFGDKRYARLNLQTYRIEP